MKKRDRNKAASKFGAGCAALFAIPFAAVSVFMGWLVLSSLLEYAAMQSWVETPARIVQSELKVENNDGATYRVLAEYDYEFSGQTHHGSRVALHEGSDNIGSFQQRVHQELKSHQSSGQPFRCYVNPQRPTESILYRELRTEMIVFLDLFVLIFGACGWGMLFGSLLLRHNQRKTAELTEQNPDQPWLWRSEWATNEIPLSGGQGQRIFLFVALYWNLATAPLWWVLPPDILKGELWALFPMILPGIGLCLLIAATRAVLTRRSLGRCQLRMRPFPATIGGPLGGTIEIERRLDTAEFALKLTCVETTRNGEDTKTTDIWTEEQLVAPETDGLLSQDAGTVIPVSFELPATAQQSTDDIEWKLTAKSPDLGHRFKLEFSIPVFAEPANSK